MSSIDDQPTDGQDSGYPRPITGQQFIQRFFDRKVQDLLNLYETTGSISHPGEKGTFREILVRSVLSSLLPPHFGLGTGIIVDKWGRQSRQTDIIVFDKRVTTCGISGGNGPFSV
jgi:hypothetical protein